LNITGPPPKFYGTRDILPDFVSIELASNCMVTRTILYSLRAA
jgi:hypothetical protein